MLPQSHCGDEEDGHIGLSSWCFVHVKHSVCHEPISVLINVCIYIYIYIVHGGCKECHPEGFIVASFYNLKHS